MALGPMIETPVKRDHPPCIGSYKTTSVKKTIKCYTIQYKNDFYSAMIEGAEALVGRL